MENFNSWGQKYLRVHVDMINGTRYTFQDFAMAVKVEPGRPAARARPGAAAAVVVRATAPLALFPPRAPPLRGRAAVSDCYSGIPAI